MARISDGKENTHIIRSNQDVIVRHRILSNTEYAIAKVMFKYITYVDDRGEMVASWDIAYPEVLIIMCTMGGFDWNYYDNEQKEAICGYFYADKNKTIRDRSELKAILEWIGYDVVFENDGSITAYW